VTAFGKHRHVYSTGRPWVTGDYRRATRFPNLIDLRLAKTPKQLGVFSKTPPTRAFSLGLTSREVFRLPAIGRRGTRGPHQAPHRRPLRIASLRPGGPLAAHPHRGPPTPGWVRTFRDRLISPRPARAEDRPSGTRSVCSFLLKACPNASNSFKGPHSKGATFTHRRTSVLGGMLGRGLLYSNSKSFPACQLYHLPAQGGQVYLRTADVHHHRHGPFLSMSLFGRPSDNRGAHHANLASGAP
jgi:hypothetical protein